MTEVLDSARRAAAERDAVQAEAERLRAELEAMTGERDALLEQAEEFGRVQRELANETEVR